MWLHVCLPLRLQQPNHRGSVGAEQTCWLLQQVQNLLMAPGEAAAV